MFKYIKFEKVETEYTILNFRGINENVKVNYFDVDVVSLEGSEADIDALITAQDPLINCIEITQEEFKELVGNSAQLNRIRDRIAEEVAKKYTLSEELGLMKRDVTDAKRVAYEAYVQECIAIGDSLKAEIGY